MKTCLALDCPENACLSRQPRSFRLVESLSKEKKLLNLPVGRSVKISEETSLLKFELQLAIGHTASVASFLCRRSHSLCRTPFFLPVQQQQRFQRRAYGLTGLRSNHPAPLDLAA